MIIDNSTIIYPLPTNELFERKEKMWRVTLPESFRTFMEQFNGGKPINGEFLCNNHSYLIDRFLCFLKEPRKNELGVYDIDVTLTQLEERLTDNEDLIGVDLLPIAVLFAGDFVCLDYRNNKQNPEVCVWKHEESFELAPVTCYITESFEQFLEIIK